MLLPLGLGILVIAAVAIDRWRQSRYEQLFADCALTNGLKPLMSLDAERTSSLEALPGHKSTGLCMSGTMHGVIVQLFVRSRVVSRDDSAIYTIPKLWWTASCRPCS